MKNKTYKFRIYPNKEQQQLINKTFGCTRFIFNRILGDAINYYKENKKAKINTPELYKIKFTFLKEVDSLALENAQLQVKAACKSLLNGNDLPRFRSKKDNYQMYTTNNVKNSVRIQDNKIKIHKIGVIKAKLHRGVVGIIKSVTISKNPTGNYYILILTEQEIQKLPTVNKKICIDLGLKEFIATSEGEFFDSSNSLKHTQNQLVKAQRKLLRKQKGSNNSNKARIKIDKLYEKMTNQRNDFLQKLSTKLIRENQTIVMEDLSIKNIMKNNKLAKAISEVLWYQFRLMLEYKSNWYGRKLIIVDEHFASSQLCPTCGYKNPIVKDLGLKERT